MDTRTRHALKKDSFAQATASGFQWMSGHRSSVVRWAAGITVALVLVIGGLVFWSLRSGVADAALGAAMDVYTGPLAQPGATPEDGQYASAAERSKAANKLFSAVAQQYGWLPAGTRAHYFAGITNQEMGQNAAAETELKAAAETWNFGGRNLSNLAKLALANLYHQTGRDGQAIDLYNALAAKPSDSVPATLAQLDLADLYAASGKQDQARKLWASVKDANKDRVVGDLAAQKLNGGK